MTLPVLIICITALSGMALHWFLYRRIQPVLPAITSIEARLTAYDAQIKELRDRTSSLALRQGFK
jgi:hypothetical protein